DERDPGARERRLEDLRRPQRLEDLLRRRRPAARRLGSVGPGRRLASAGREERRSEPRAPSGAHPARRRLQRWAGARRNLPHRRDPRRDPDRVRSGDPRYERGGLRMIPEVYRKLGVRPIIHGSGTTTRYGGSRLRPDARGLPNEIVIQRAHRFAYDQAYRVAGGVLVEIGLARRTQPFELEDAITEKTAAVAYLISPFTSPPGVLTLAQVVAIAHRRG